MEVGLTTWQAPAEATVSAQHSSLVSIIPSEKWLPKTQIFTSLSLVYFSIYLIIAQITEQVCLFVLYTASLESAENFRLIMDFQYMDFVEILCNGFFALLMCSSLGWVLKGVLYHSLRSVAVVRTNGILMEICRAGQRGRARGNIRSALSNGFLLHKTLR